MTKSSKLTAKSLKSSNSKGLGPSVQKTIKPTANNNKKTSNAYDNQLAQLKERAAVK